MGTTRLLLIADSKMLPALANGLRDGAGFDVHAVPLSDPAGAQAAAENADAVALFYGAPGAPLPAALQALSPKVRERGGRIVAVLQREQLSQRDDCFRAGASDLLFMPMPKEQFVARLQGSLELSWAADGGAPAPVSVATRKSASRIEKAKVSATGVEAAAELPLKAGETVRLQWGTFQTWGLVVRGGPSAQIRFAGLAPDEETQIRSWVAGGVQRAPTPAGGSAPVAAERETSAPEGVSPATPPAGSAPAAPGRAAPAAGPPPGFADRFADRKPVRPQARAPVRASSPPAAPEPAARASPTPAPAASAPVLSALFEEGGSSAATPAPAAEPPPPGPPWPVPAAADACRSAALQVLADEAISPDAPPSVAASARKIAGLLGSAERTALESAGPESPLAAALFARIALDASTSEGLQLASAGSGATVDTAALAALTKQADEAAARLQKEANTAVAAGEVEDLQIITGASAALSRDLLALRGTSDRLQGATAAPRLGAGADPDLVLPGQAPRTRTHASVTPAPVRADLRDFHDLDRKPGRGKHVAMLLAVAALAGALGYAIYFSVPHHTQIATAAAGRGVERIDVSGPSALVTVDRAWLESSAARIPSLVAVLKQNGVKKAILILPNGSPAGVLDTATGKVSGLAAPKPAADPPK